MKGYLRIIAFVVWGGLPLMAKEGLYWYDDAQKTLHNPA